MLFIKKATVTICSCSTPTVLVCHGSRSVKNLYTYGWVNNTQPHRKGPVDNSVVDVKPQSVIAYYCVHGKNLVMKKTLTLIRPGFFASWDRCGGGGGEVRKPPLCNLKTAHPRATKITHNKVLIIFNFSALTQWRNMTSLYRHIVEFIDRIYISLKVDKMQKNSTFTVLTFC